MKELHNNLSILVLLILASTSQIVHAMEDNNHQKNSAVTSPAHQTSNWNKVDELEDKVIKVMRLTPSLSGYELSIRLGLEPNTASQISYPNSISTAFNLLLDKTKDERFGLSEERKKEINDKGSAYTFIADLKLAIAKAQQRIKDKERGIGMSIENAEKNIEFWENKFPKEKKYEKVLQQISDAKSKLEAIKRLNH